MNHDVIEGKLHELVGIELAESNKAYGLFHSLHEGYAVLREEVEEASEALSLVKGSLSAIWLGCRNNSPSWVTAQDVEHNALQLASEALQTAAMARKLKMFATAAAEAGEPHE